MKTPILIECPRDAMQGIKNWIPTEAKIMYIQSLLSVGFDVLDVGSFVSPKAIPQMKDTAVVLENIDFSECKSELLVIVANLRGALEAVKYDAITYIGFPLSVSENFQMRNTHKTQEEALFLLDQLIEVCNNSGKKLVVYLSMGFGNPYGDPWSSEIIEKWVEIIIVMGVKIISISDTVGKAKVSDVSNLYSTLISRFPEIEFGAHFHTHPNQWYEKVRAANIAGCFRFDGTIMGWGGCPMAQDALVGNMPMEKLISYFTTQNKLPPEIDVLAFESAYNFSHNIFSSIR